MHSASRHSSPLYMFVFMFAMITELIALHVCSRLHTCTSSVRVTSDRSHASVCLHGNRSHTLPYACCFVMSVWIETRCGAHDQRSTPECPSSKSDVCRVTILNKSVAPDPSNKHDRLTLAGTRGNKRARTHQGSRSLSGSPFFRFFTGAFPSFSTLRFSPSFSSASSDM